MVFISIILLLITSLAILAICLRDVLSPQKEAVSMKIIFLLGFLFFQPSSTIFTLLTGETDVLYVENQGGAAFIFTLLTILFVAIFLWSYSKGWGVTRFARRPTLERSATNAGLIGASIICFAVGFVCRDIIGTTVPVLGVLTFQLASGIYVASVAYAAWAWFRDPRRLFTGAWLLFMIVVVSASFLSVEWSRRGILSVFIGIGWVGYFVTWRYLSRQQLLKWVTVLLLVGLVPVTLQSALRGAAQGGGGSERGSNALGGLAGYADALSRMSPSDLMAPIMEIAAAQFAGSNSLWLIEECPTVQPHWPLHQLIYLTVQPVPRIFWENKPTGLGREMVIVGGVRNVGDEHNLGPGIIGHCWVDIWWLSIPIYAMILGLVMRYLDERASFCVTIPWIVIPLGAGTAHIFGISRGETGLFAFNTIAAISGAWFASAIAGYFFSDRSAERLLVDDGDSGEHAMYHERIPGHAQPE